MGGVVLRVDAVTGDLPNHVVLRFRVEDTGPGICEDDLARIFQPFEQLEGRQSTEAGAGLGLAICKQYVEMMGGHIGVESKPGNGSTFHFEIQCPIPTANGSVMDLHNHHITGLSDGQRRFRILIAEDQLENRLLLRHMLEAMDFDLREAVNGQEAVDICEEWQPDLIWMDIRMPVMGGMEATRRIKATASGAHTKVIALTAHALEAERRDILSAGCDDFIRKPYRESDIFDAMAKHLQLKYDYEPDAATLLPTDANSGLLAEQLAVLPPELRLKLYRAVIELDTSQTLAMIEQVSVYDDSLGSALASIAKRLEYDRLLRLLETAETKS